MGKDRQNTVVIQIDSVKLLIEQANAAQVQLAGTYTRTSDSVRMGEVKLIV